MVIVVVVVLVDVFLLCRNNKMKEGGRKTIEQERPQLVYQQLQQQQHKWQRVETMAWGMLRNWGSVDGYRSQHSGAIAASAAAAYLPNYGRVVEKTMTTSERHSSRNVQVMGLLATQSSTSFSQSSPSYCLCSYKMPFLLALLLLAMRSSLKLRSSSYVGVWLSQVIFPIGSGSRGERGGRSFCCTMEIAALKRANCGDGVVVGHGETVRQLQMKDTLLGVVIHRLAAVINGGYD